MKRIVILSLVALAALTLGSTTAVAQDASSAPAQQPQMSSEAQAMIQKLRKKSAKLQQIHQKAIKANPELKQEQEDFVDLVRKEIQNQGYDVEAGQKHVQQLAQKLQSDDVSDDERQSLMQEYKAERQDQMKARSAAMQQSNVQDARDKLQDNTIAAMKQQDGDTQALLDDVQQLREKIRSTLQSQAPAGN